MNTSGIINKKLLLEKLQGYAIKIGRMSARPVILLYFVMTSKDTPKSDKLLILSTLSYLVLPVNLISAKRLPIIGWMDEAVSLTVAYQKVCKYITPSMERKADAILARWFPTYTSYIEVVD
uniref:YkvA family protein n=1 Tax=Segatella hominis TaxID=2518605 RepID=UPI004025E9B5